ncbi:MAG: MCE family protein [Saprospiraceae bacterium]|nr:MCE family protein [Saprospiraceae bacterium]
MSKEIKIGLLAVVATGLLIWGYKFLLGTNILKRSNTFYVEYGNVDNLQISAPIFVNGFKVGTVKDVYMKPEDLNRVMVVLDVERRIKLPQNTVAELGNAGMMGGKMINLRYTGNCDSDCIQSGSTLQGKSLGFIESLVQPSEIDLYMESIKHGIEGVIDTINQTLVEGNPEEGLGKTIADLRVAVANLKGMTMQMNQLFANSSSHLVSVFNNLESVTNNIKENNEQISGLLKNANDITAQLANARLDTTLFKANRALGSTNDAIGTLDETLEKANATFKELQTLLASLNAGKGTMGSLMKDQELYDNLNVMSKNLNYLLQDVRLHPKRYINVSVFGKKNKPYDYPDIDPAFPIDTTTSN